MYDRHKAQLDRDYLTNFRRETPKRVSELFFAAAFAEAGWDPAARVTGFDLAYHAEHGRILVEVTTPAAPPPGSWTEEVKDGVTLYSGDSNTTEAALLRLTTGFVSKANQIKNRLDACPELARDYKVIALSGFQISQETPFAPSSNGNVPDFIRAFLPIGDMYARFPVGPGSDEREVEWGYQSSPEIRKETGSTVARTAFLDPLFPHVDAVAYSPVNLLGLKNPRWQVGVLHNPTGARLDGERDLGMGNEYFVTIEAETFGVRRRKLPELPPD
jgi:hypothetical protein